MPLLDTPDAALNRAFGWSAGRAGASVAAGPGVPGADWDGADFAHLIEDARLFHRVGTHALADPAGFIREVVDGLFGVRAEGAGGRYDLAPWVPDGWPRMALRRLRCHRSLVDLELRPRAEWCTMLVSLEFGPAIPVSLSLRNTPPVARITVDEIALAGELAVFTLSGEHEAVFYYGDAG
jgi:hypothetical protein